MAYVLASKQTHKQGLGLRASGLGLTASGLGLRVYVLASKQASKRTSRPAFALAPTRTRPSTHSHTHTHTHTHTQVVAALGTLSDVGGMPIRACVNRDCSPLLPSLGFRV